MWPHIGGKRLPISALFQPDIFRILPRSLRKDRRKRCKPDVRIASYL